jgi:hypothetical protein
MADSCVQMNKFVEFNRLVIFGMKDVQKFMYSELYSLQSVSSIEWNVIHST